MRTGILQLRGLASAEGITMKRYIKRLALPLGAAAVLGTAGFAYMASNTVATAGLGEGYAPVAGYTTTNIGFNVDNGIHAKVGSNCGGLDGCHINNVQFHLASQAAPGTQAYDNPPAYVYVSLLNSSAVSVSNSGNSNGTSTCTQTSIWNNGAAGADYNCTVSGTGTLNNVQNVDVAANQ